MSKQTSSGGLGWLLSLATYATLAGMYYLWQIKGMEQAGNVFMFYVWFIGSVGSILLFTEPRASDYRAGTAYRNAAWVSAAFLVLLGALWAGHTFGATVYAISILAAQVRRAKAKELSEAAQ